MKVTVAVVALVLGFGWARQMPGQEETRSIRFATFNTSLNRDEPNKLIADLRGDDRQARQIAEVLQRVRPDVVLLNEFDFDEQRAAATLFREKYLQVGQGGAQPIRYEHVFTAPVNTGVASGLDLNQDGRPDGPEDAFGFGRHPGQYGMLVLSRYPIELNAVRTFQKFRWSEMPRAQRPQNPETGQPFYDDATWKRLRLPSKSFWDLPIRVGAAKIHLLASHPTPPVFDGPEDRNGRRNHDEIRLLSDYLSPGRNGYLVDDRGGRGGLPEREPFVIAGDLNADPQDGDSSGDPVAKLLKHARINNSSTPASEGGKRSGERQAQRGNPAHDTAAFGGSAGNLRVDYVLPSRELKIVKSGVFWPTPGSAHADLLSASDHRLVWVDIRVPPAADNQE